MFKSTEIDFMLRPQLQFDVGSTTARWKEMFKNFYFNFCQKKEEITSETGEKVEISSAHDKIDIN